MCSIFKKYNFNTNHLIEHEVQNLAIVSHYQDDLEETLELNPSMEMYELEDDLAADVKGERVTQTPVTDDSELVGEYLDDDEIHSDDESLISTTLGHDQPLWLPLV